jgi:hypothetical protein
MYTNAVYFPNRRIYQGDTPGMLNYGCVNHVYYAYATVSPDGAVIVSFNVGWWTHASSEFLILFLLICSMW